MPADSLFPADDFIETTFVLGDGVTEQQLFKAIPHLEALMSLSMEHPVTVKANIVDAFPPKKGKRRPIRREVTA